MPRSLFLNVHQALLCEKEGNMFIHLFQSLTHSPPCHPPTTQSPPRTYTRKFASPTHPEVQARYPLSKDLSLDVKIKMIFIVRMIVNVRTLWLSLIQLRLRCFVATFSAVYNRRISNLHDPSDATRYVFRYFFFIAKEKVIHQGRIERARANLGRMRLSASDVRVAENNSQLLRIPVLFIVLLVIGLNSASRRRSNCWWFSLYRMCYPIGTCNFTHIR